MSKIELYSDKEFDKPLEERSYYLKELKRYSKDKNLNEEEIRMVTFLKCRCYNFFPIYLNVYTGESFGKNFKEDMGYCWFKNKELAEELGMDIKDTIKIKKNLIRLSYIKVRGENIEVIK